MSFGDRFCFSRKGGIGGGGWVHPKGANSMATSGLVSRNNLVGTGRAISVFFGLNGVRNKQYHFVGPPFPVFKTCFSATAGWHFLRDLTRRLLIGGYGQSRICLGWLKLPLGAVLTLTTQQNRNWGAFNSCRK